MAAVMTILKDREEWLKHRMNGIGGSEISSVLGLNPFMDNVKLYEIKTGIREADDISDKPYVKYGTEAEHYLRELFRLDYPQYVMHYEENNSWKNEKYPWAQASLDGWLTDESGRLGIWECKTSNILTPQQRLKWDNKIPDNYYCQVLMYMAVMDAQFAVLKAQLKTEYGEVFLTTKHYFIEREEVQDDIDYIMAAGEKFWTNNVMKRCKPNLILPSI